MPKTLVGSSGKEAETEFKPPKIGGWLILANINILGGIFSSVYIVMFVISHLAPFGFRGGPPRWSLLDLTILSISIGFFLLNLYLITVFQRRKKIAPKVFIIESLIEVIGVGALFLQVPDVFGIYFVPICLRSAFWTIYFIRSKRVKATFICEGWL